jgi:hypothetical protein
MKAGCKALGLASLELTFEEQADLAEMGFFAETANSNAALIADTAYRDILESDVIGKLRQQVTTLRASGHRRRELKQTIHDLNQQNPPERQLRVQALLKDMDVRWSSTFLMIDRALNLAPVSWDAALTMCRVFTVIQAVQTMLKKAGNEDIAHVALSDAQYKVLADIRMFLEVAHHAQQILSAEKTPTLSLALPLYERLIVTFKKLETKRPKIAHAVRSARLCIERYLTQGRKTRAYSLAISENCC